MNSWETFRQSNAAVCLQVFGQRMHDQIVPGCALKLDSTCLNLNASYLSVEPLAPNRASLLLQSEMMMMMTMMAKWNKEMRAAVGSCLLIP